MALPFANDGSFMAQFLAMQQSGEAKSAEQEGASGEAGGSAATADPSYTKDGESQQNKDGKNDAGKSQQSPKESEGASESAATGTAEETTSATTASAEANEAKDTKKPVVDPAKKKSILSSFSTKLVKKEAPKEEELEDGPKRKRNEYLAEMAKYKQSDCGAGSDSKRPLVK